MFCFILHPSPPPCITPPSLHVPRVCDTVMLSDAVDACAMEALARLLGREASKSKEERQSDAQSSRGGYTTEESSGRCEVGGEQSRR